MAYTPEQLAAARTLMADYTLTVEEVARRTGISVQTLYKHFPDLKGRGHGHGGSHGNHPIAPDLQGRTRHGRPPAAPEKLTKARILMADHALTIAEVVRRSGLSRRTLYKYFPNLKGSRQKGCRPKPTPKKLVVQAQQRPHYGDKSIESSPSEQSLDHHTTYRTPPEHHDWMPLCPERQNQRHESNNCIGPMG